MNRQRAVLLGVLLLVAAPASAAPTRFVGVNAHQPANDILDAIKDLGATWVRIDFNWFQAQPQASTPPDFTFFDGIVNAAIARGLKVFPTVGYAPAWAAEPDADGKPNNNAPKPGEYGKFCQAAAAHFAGRITHWGLWNEPNLGDFFEGTRQQWIDRVVVEGITGIKAGCPSCLVLGPEMASIGGDYWVWLDDVLKQLKAKNMMFDIITWHIYAGFLELNPSWMCWSNDLFLHKLDAHRVCFGVHIGLSLREVLLQNNLGNLPVWITETGRTAHLGAATEEADQVTFYRRVLEEQLQRPYWTHTFFYEIVDDNLINDKWGLAVRTGGAPSYPGSYQLKAVWAFLKKVLGAAAFGGTKTTDCDDGLDNDLDKLIDYPKDTDCASLTAPAEGKVVPPDGGVKDGPAAPDAGGPGREGGRDDFSVQRDVAITGDGTGSDGPRRDAPRTSGDGGGAGDGCACALREGRPESGAGVALAALLLVVALVTRARRGGRGR
jgi:hypothetical protein